MLGHLELGVAERQLILHATVVGRVLPCTHELRVLGHFAQSLSRIERVPDRLYFTDSDEANELIAKDPMALLIGFSLDQQVTVQQAFMGPLRLRERLGSLDPGALAAADLEPLFRQKPAIHRFPGNMAQRVHALAVDVRDHYGGDAARVWSDAADSAQLRRNISELPGFGEMKVKALGAVLAKRFGVAAAQGLVPSHPTLGDVDSGQALNDYQAAKRERKKSPRAERDGVGKPTPSSRARSIASGRKQGSR